MHILPRILMVMCLFVISACLTVKFDIPNDDLEGLRQSAESVGQGIDPARIDDVREDQQRIAQLEAENARLHQGIPHRQARVGVHFESIKNLESSNECDAEAYLILSVNGSAPHQPWGKSSTDRDQSTLHGCGAIATINQSIFINLAENENLTVQVNMYEKDGDYHPAAMYTKTFYGAGDWASRQGAITETSIRDGGAYGDQDFEITYHISFEWQ